MRDVPGFIRKGQEIYGYPHFVNDVGGSLCELDEPGVVELLAEHTLILYIQTTTREEEDTLIKRAQSDPKPLYFRPAFLAEQLPVYLREKGLEYVAQVEPDDFARWVFPRLFHSRIPRYEAIAGPHGYTVTSQEVAQVRDERDFLALLETAIARKSEASGRERRGVIMPLVAHNALPTFERLRQDGITVLSTERAANQEIRDCTSAC